MRTPDSLETSLRKLIPLVHAGDVKAQQQAASALANLAVQRAFGSRIAAPHCTALPRACTKTPLTLHRLILTLCRVTRRCAPQPTTR